MPLQILLVDDHPIVRQGVRALLEREKYVVGGEAADGHEAIRKAKELQPDLALVDLAMPLLNGLDACREIVRVSPSTQTIVLTMCSEDHYVLEALRVGVRGYVLKTRAAADLLQAIQEVSRGKVYLSPGVSEAVVQAYLAKSELPPDPLSARERQVLQLVAEGKSTKEVASLLGVSVKTADSHRTRMMKKLGIHETAGLVRYAVRRGIVQP